MLGSEAEVYKKKNKKAVRLIHFFSFTLLSLGAKYETGLNWLFMLLGLTY